VYERPRTPLGSKCTLEAASGEGLDNREIDGGDASMVEGLKVTSDTESWSGIVIEVELSENLDCGFRAA